ncbi:MAG TPA: EAL domain-containing protein [Reyranella sp.]|nr:EAL domain-containing protein [Reyranella sp.]
MSRAFSPTAFGTALGRRARGRAGRASSRPEVIFGRCTSIPADQIVIHYQPVIGIEDRRIRSVEALVRWRHPRRGLLKPDSFIGQAERSGTIISLTWHVLEKVVRQQVAWKARGVALAVAVNISALFLASLKRADQILELLQRERFEPHRLTLEITETEAAQSAGRTRPAEQAARRRRHRVDGRLWDGLLEPRTHALSAVRRSTRV